LSHYVTQAKTILAIDIFNKNMTNLVDEDQEHPLRRKQKVCEEPLKILEETLLDTLRQISVQDLPAELSWYALNDDVPIDIRMHPFLDKILY